MELTENLGSPASRPAPLQRRARHARSRASRGSRGSGASAGAWGLLAVCLVLTFLNFAAWSLSTPLYASPDEPVHVIRAAAAVRGQLVGRTVKDVANAYTQVTVPDVFATGGVYAHCFAFHPTVPASCAPPLTPSTRTVSAQTYVGRYPPFYYLVVGLPSLAFPSKSGIYLMRFMSALLNAVLVSLAFVAVLRWSRRRILLAGVLVAVTPMAWFLGGVVNPSGFEICAAVCLWTAGVVLVREHPDHPPPGLVVIVAASAAALMLARPISPLWVAIIAAVLAILGGWRAATGLLHSRAARWSAVPVAASGALAMWWLVAEHSLDLLSVGVPVGRDESGARLALFVFDQTPAWLHQMVGVFGWLDTPSPLLTYVVWSVAGGAVVIAGLLGGTRVAVAMVVVILAVLAVPVALSVGQAHRLGIIWQGRYTLPIAAGLPLVGLSSVRPLAVLRRWRVPLVVAAAAAMAVAAMAAYLEALRRYAVGVSGPIDFLGARWHPPLGSTAVAAGGCALLAVLWAFVAFEWGHAPSPNGEA
jgi:hypothetical protein